MDEYQLIEIAKRFRVLEDFLEASERHGFVLDADDLEFMLNACREDMTAMQESIRDQRGKHE